MSINFLNLEKVESQTIRPDGYKFPKGLSARALDPAQQYSVVDPASYITTSQAIKSETPTYVSYTWNTTGSFEQSLPEGLVGDLLIVAGGGAGQTKGAGDGGHSGGGAGGLLYYSETNGLTGPPGPASANSKTPNGPAISLAPGVNFAVVVGVGGAGQGDATIGIGNGGPSSFANTSPDVPAPQQLNLVATGGGSQPQGTSQPGQPGGSGSGKYGPGSVGTGISGQGNPGAVGLTGSPGGYSGGGGGGAGGPGSDVTDLNPRSGKDGNPAPASAPGVPATPYDNAYRYASGGDGLDFDISGTRRTYAAGGGGSGRGFAWFGGSNNLGGRGSGGGTSGGSTPSPWNITDAGGNGTISRGSGGGGGTSGGFGGGGVVIIQFRKDQFAGIYSIN